MAEMSGLEVEYTLREVAKLACGDECYRNWASYINQEFGPRERRALIDLLFKILWKAWARRRYYQAAYSPRILT
jgi:hypothetical protein